MTGLKRAVLTLCLLCVVYYPAREQKVAEKTFYEVGDYLIEESARGYQARKGGNVSSWQKTMFKSITKIQLLTKN